MKKRFIEISTFTELVQTLGPNWDENYADLQNLLMEDPEHGKVIPGCGGLRKVRLADPKRGKGKRGGARVLYLHVSEADWIFLIDVYDKNDKEDLSAQEKKVLRALTEQLRDEAFAAVKELEEDYQ
jgi:hypothetical protein